VFCYAQSPLCAPTSYPTICLYACHAKASSSDSHGTVVDGIHDLLFSLTGQIAVDKFGRNTVRSSIIVDYDDRAVTQVVAPLFAAKTEHLYPIPSADSNMRNMQVR
jgi:hypothetical protein